MGDHSGEQYAKTLINKCRDTDFQIAIWGNNSLCTPQDQWLGRGVDGVMGFSSVAKNIYRHWVALRTCKQSVEAFNPDVIILIDNAGFNLRILSWAGMRKYKIVYYIPPKVWASRPGRFKLLKKHCNLVIPIYPFEHEYFLKTGLNSFYAGNSHLSALSAHIAQNTIRDEQSIAFLPGSRMQEIREHIGILKDLAPLFPYITWHIVVASNLTVSDITSFFISALPPNVKMHLDPVINLLSQVRLAVICSGTATMEACLANCPQIIIYRTSKINYAIAKKLITIPMIGLPNLIYGDKIIPELIQDQCTPSNIAIEIKLLLQEEHCQNQLHGYRTVIRNLNNGDVDAKISEAIVAIVRDTN